VRPGLHGRLPRRKARAGKQGARCQNPQAPLASTNFDYNHSYLTPSRALIRRLEDEAVEQAVSSLAADNGTLRCRHGNRLVVLYGRGVATLEVAPRGAIL
jgi:hypothetical protein